MLSLLRKKFSSYLSGEEGVTLPVVAVTLMMLLAATGTAVDIGRAELVQAKLSSSLDAAGLAVGSTISTTDPTALAQNYLNVNFPSGYLGATITNLTVTLNQDNTVITLSASASVPNTIMKIFGFNNTVATATSEITRANYGMELVLVMDNTGSMSHNSKLSAMKIAATDLINILYGSNNTVDNLWVGLVPFSQAVNIGTSRSSWVDSTYLNSLDWGPTSWAGCVEAGNTKALDESDDVPSAQQFKAYYWPDDGNNNWEHPPGWAWGWSKSYTIDATHGPNKYCPQPVTAMTASKSTIINGINAMTATGMTHINQGAVWGWRMLSPKWKTLWGGEMNTNSLPLDYNSSMMYKVMILLSDGDNTIDNNSRTAYGYLNHGRLGSTNQNTAEDELDTRTRDVCNSMKANGIIIYTIGLGNPGAKSSALLENCASKAEYYFDTPTNAELNTAFHTIGDSLANLRISQ